MRISPRLQPREIMVANDLVRYCSQNVYHSHDFLLYRVSRIVTNTVAESGITAAAVFEYTMPNDSAEKKNVSCITNISEIFTKAISTTFNHHLCHQANQTSSLQHRY